MTTDHAEVKCPASRFGAWLRRAADPLGRRQPGTTPALAASCTVSPRPLSHPLT